MTRRSEKHSIGPWRKAAVGRLMGVRKVLI